VPDRFFRTDLAQAAAGKAAPDREGQRDPLTTRQRRHADHRSDQRAGVRTRDQTGEK
jgi:hypothetical protein